MFFFFKIQYTHCQYQPIPIVWFEKRSISAVRSIFDFYFLFFRTSCLRRSFKKRTSLLRYERVTRAIRYFGRRRVIVETTIVVSTRSGERRENVASRRVVSMTLLQPTYTYQWSLPPVRITQYDRCMETEHFMQITAIFCRWLSCMRMRVCNMTTAVH